MIHTTVFLFVLDAGISPFWPPSRYDVDLDIFRSVPLSPTRARVHVRCPYPFGEWAHHAALGGAGPDPFETTTEAGAELDAAVVLNSYPLRIVYREAPLAGDALLDAHWVRGPLLHLNEVRDWSATATLSNLWPATTYEWTTAFAHNHTRPVRSRVHTFTTFPTSTMLRPPRFANQEPDHLVLNAINDSDLNTETFIVEPVDEWKVQRPYPIVERPLPDGPVLAPLDDPHHFVFGSTSCVKANVPYNPAQFKLWAGILRLLGVDGATRNRIYGLELLADRAKQGGLRFFLQLGDWIYADVPLYSWGYTRESLLSHYRNLYRGVYASLGWQQLAEIGTPFYGAADDHEILNNWSGKDPSPKVRKAVRYGFQAWFEYVGLANPRATPADGSAPLDEDEVDQDALDELWNSEPITDEIRIQPVEHETLLDMDQDDSEEQVLEEQEDEQLLLPTQPPNDSAAPLPEAWYDFRYGDTAFFVFDARRYREPPKPDGSGSVLGDVQLSAFLNWLSATNDSSTTFKFVVSSFPFTSLWAGGWDVDAKKDSWAAYLQERDILLEKMASVPNVIVLSGDRHEFVAAALAPKKTAEQEADEGYTHWPVVELSTSPLNMFYLPIRTASQEHGRGITGQEQLVKYLPKGNVKWSEFEVDTRDPAHPVVHVVLFVDGKPAWAADIIGTSVLKPRTPIAQALGQAAKSLLEWLGLKPASWF